MKNFRFATREVSEFIFLDKEDKIIDCIDTVMENSFIFSKEDTHVDLTVALDSLLMRTIVTETKKILVIHTIRHETLGKDYFLMEFYHPKDLQFSFIREAGEEKAQYSISFYSTHSYIDKEMIMETDKGENHIINFLENNGFTTDRIQNKRRKYIRLLEEARII